MGKDSTLDKIGWYKENSGGWAHPVGQKLPNAWGLYDMAGNVWEWCHDLYGAYPSSSVTDPVGTTGTKRVVRSGGLSDYAHSSRAAHRVDDSPGYRAGDVGFRLVRSLHSCEQGHSHANCASCRHRWLSSPINESDDAVRPHSAR